MKKYWYIIMMTLCCTLAFTACNKDDEEVVDEEWKQENLDAFNAIAKDPTYTKLESIGNMGPIYYKVLKKGEGTKPIYYTSVIKFYYTGTLINGIIFDQREYPDQYPYEEYVNNLAKGVITALQEMHVGDRWEIWMPYTLGYGASGSIDGSVPGYSTLKFEMEVAEIVQE